MEASKTAQPISCCNCGMVFNSNVSLVLHVEKSHKLDEIITHVKRRRTVETLQNFHHLIDLNVGNTPNGHDAMISGMVEYSPSLQGITPVKPSTSANVVGYESTVMKPEFQAQEIIVISDDEEDVIDLTLRL